VISLRSISKNRFFLISRENFLQRRNNTVTSLSLSLSLSEEEEEEEEVEKEEERPPQFQVRAIKFSRANSCTGYS